MFITNVISIILLVLTTKYHIVVGQCYVNIKDDIVRQVDPAFIRYNQLWPPVNNALTWYAGQITEISCPGIDNKVLVCRETAPKVEIKCIRGKTFQLIDGSYAYSEQFHCQKSETANIRPKPQEQCTLYNWENVHKFVIGFESFTNFVTHIEVCYNNLTGVPLYTEHILQGSAITYKVISGQRPSFNKQYSANMFNIDKAYTQESQKIRLIQLLGQEKANDYFPKELKNKGFYFAKGHLTPDADGILNSWQRATYYYVNAAPQWQIINQGNWKRVEDAVRNFAAKRSLRLLIITGVHDILTLEDENNNQVGISLANNGGLVVPKWFWKIVKSNENGAAIVFVTLNNPHVTSEIPLCTNYCEHYGWYDTSYSNVTRGYTYCCSLHDFKLAVRYLPSRINAEGILKN